MVKQKSEKSSGKNEVNKESGLLWKAVEENKKGQNQTEEYGNSGHVLQAVMVVYPQKRWLKKQHMKETSVKLGCPRNKE